MSRHLRALVAAAIATIGLAASVSAHDITGVDVSCDGQLIVVHGVNFPATTVQVSGPHAYSAHFDVQGNWTHQLALGQDGEYFITWPGAGSHATSFVVECEQATPTPKVTPKPTPERTPTPAPATHRPNVTPPPTDAGTTSAINESGVLIAVIFVVVAAALGFAAAGRRR